MLDATVALAVGALALRSCARAGGQSGQRMLAQPERSGEPPQPNSTIYFKVADSVAAQQELALRRANLEGEPHCVARLPDHELWMSFFRDLDRNLIGLMSERRKTEP